LENVLGHACMMVMGETIDLADFPSYLLAPGTAVLAEALAAPQEMGSLEEQERILLVKAMEAAGGNQSEAARILRIGRDALRYKMKKHSLA
jgi:DNA-binding NtrC family response regulator